MTIKRGRWAGRIPGLRWGGQQVKREPSALLDFETQSFVGFDPGRKDESAMVVAARLPSGRLLFTSIKPPTKEEAEKQLEEYRALFPWLRPYQEEALKAMQTHGTAVTLFPRNLGRPRVLKELEYFKGYSGKGEDFSPSEDSD